MVVTGRLRLINELLLGVQGIQREGTGQLLMGTPLVVAVEAPHLVEGEERHLVLVVAPRKTGLGLVRAVEAAVEALPVATALPVSS